jgi:hypothetical protein
LLTWAIAGGEIGKQEDINLPRLWPPPIPLLWKYSPKKL